MEMMGRPSESTSTDSGVVVIEESALFNSNVDISANIMKSKNNSVNIDKSVDNKEKSENNSGKNSDDTRDSPVSTHISIESLENDEDSSVIDSDSDCDEIPPNGDFIIQKLGQHASESGTDGIVVISQSTNQNPVCTNGITAKPNIGTIAVQNSTDITFGSKTFYQGPVTIKQFLLDKDKWKPKTDDGNINPAFDATDTASRTKFSGKGLKHDKYVVSAKAAKITGILLSVLCILTIVYMATTYSMRRDRNQSRLGDGEDRRKNIPVNTTIGQDLIGGGKVFRLISRIEWNAQPPNGVLKDSNLPSNKIIITETKTEGCEDQATCNFRVRKLQSFHIYSLKMDDIPYNFLVGGDGQVYEGRGWDKECVSPKGYDKSIYIAFIGTFLNNPPSKRQLDAAQLLIEEGLTLEKLSKDYTLYGHRIGAALNETIKNWKNWSSNF